MSQHSLLANPRALRNVLSEFDINAKHSMGQNFLIDDNVVGKILDLVHEVTFAHATGLPILEVGPGIGSLSVALLAYSHVIAVEKDSTLLPVLAHTTAGLPHTLHVINIDALKLDKDMLVSVQTGLSVENVLDNDTTSKLASSGNAEEVMLPYMLVANLPYKIAATLILDYFERFPFIDTMVVMVQREVADRISAHPGTKDYGAYSLKLSMLAHVTARFEVSHNCFYPQPRVESAVIRLQRISPDESNLSEENRKKVYKVIDAAFAQRRKTIRNSMSSVFSKEHVDEMLSAANIDPKVRAEQLSLNSFISMAVR